MRGRKPKPTFLRIVGGNAGKRPLPRGVPDAPGQAIKPETFTEPASALWDEIVGNAPWLGRIDGCKLHVFVELMCEFQRAPAEMTAARIGQLRGVGSDLGLDPSARTRLGTGGSQPKDDIAAEFFE